MKKKLAILGIFLLAFGLNACTDTNKALEVLEDEGFKSVAITGYEWTGCSDSDMTSTGFDAISEHGHHMHGVVCCGWGPFSKGCTVRIK